MNARIASAITPITRPAATSARPAMVTTRSWTTRSSRQRNPIATRRARTTGQTSFTGRQQVSFRAPKHSQPRRRAETYTGTSMNVAGRRSATRPSPRPGERPRRLRCIGPQEGVRAEERPTAQADGLDASSHKPIASWLGLSSCVNMRRHAQTRQTPIDRFTSQGSLHAAEPSLLREDCRWSVIRRGISAASVSLSGNRYAVDALLIGRRVELRSYPEDLTRLDVYWEGRPAGQAIPFIVGRPRAPPGASGPPIHATAVGERRLPRSDRGQA
jgi:hypothetical protein